MPACCVNSHNRYLLGLPQRIPQSPGPPPLNQAPLVTVTASLRLSQLCHTRPHPFLASYRNSPVQGQVSLLLALGDRRRYLFGLALRIHSRKDPLNEQKQIHCRLGILKPLPVA